MMLSALRGFERSVCACSTCKQICRSGSPGCLAPGDVDAIAEHLGLEEATAAFLNNSFEARQDGPRTAVGEFPDGKTPSIRPKIREDGTCIFFDRESERCTIHKVAPFECRSTLACQPDENGAALKMLGKVISNSIDQTQLWLWLWSQQHPDKPITTDKEPPR